MTATTETAIRALDPFGFFAGHASAIKGLGGRKRGPDPTYAFHTPYLEYRPGPVVFTIRFTGFDGTEGELAIHVNGFVPGNGAVASIATTARASVAELAAGMSEIIVRINVIPGVSYAMLGYFPEGTDASASTMTIEAEELGDLESAAVPAEAFLPTRFGVTDLARPGRLVTEATPSFAQPLSQVMTPAQLDEDAYRAWAPMLGANLPAQDAWKQAFVLQALDCYGMRRAGATGLSIGDGSSAIGAILANEGCSILFGLAAATDPLPDHPTICPTVRLAAQCSVRELKPGEPPEDMRGFDFLWSLDAAAQAGSPRAARYFVDRSLRVLKPGGLAIFMFDMHLGDEDLPGPTLSRQRIEAIALSAISKGEEAAQLNFGGWAAAAATHQQTVPFGLIIRRR